jgi:hypothetical protein
MTGVVKVFNSAGELVATLSQQLSIYAAPTGLAATIPSFDPDEGGAGVLDLLGSGVPVIWSGKTDSGQFVDSGLYYVTVDVTDTFGKLVTWTAPITVLRTDASTVVEVYNSAGELVWRETRIPSNPGRISLSDGSLVAGQPGAELKITYGSGSGDFVSWNGTGSQGQALSGGSYLVKVTQAGSGGKSTFSYSVTLLQANTPAFSSLVAAPNPVRSGTTAITISLLGAAPGLSAWGDAYNLSGERVSSLEAASAGTLRWTIPPGLASGVYLLHVSARDSQGRLKSAPLKVAIVR